MRGGVWDWDRLAWVPPCVAGGVFVCGCVIYTVQLWADVCDVVVPYFRDQTPRLLFISSRDFLRPLFEGGH